MKTVLYKAGGMLKAVVSAVVSAAAISVADGKIDYKTLGAAAVGGVIVYFMPNLQPQVQAIEAEFPDPVSMLAPELPQPAPVQVPAPAPPVAVAPAPAEAAPAPAPAPPVPPVSA